MAEKEYQVPKTTLQDWELAAEKQMKGKPVESLTRTTAEGIAALGGC